MLYREITPHDQLKPFVLDYWLFQVPSYEVLGQQEVQHVAPADGCVSLLFICNQQLRMSFVIGPSTEVLQTPVQADTCYFGIRFVPGMFCALFGDNGLDLKNQQLPAQHFLPECDLHPMLSQHTTDFANISLVDEWLLQLLAQRASVAYDMEVNKAVRYIMASGGNIAISSVLEKACLSERQLQKRFRRSTYLTMKELARICRLRHTITKVHLEHKSIAEAVYEAGYFDQAHYNHDLQQATKHKPQAFYQHISQIEHVDVKPLQQTLE